MAAAVRVHHCGVRWISSSRVSAKINSPPPITDIDSSINTMDRILSILQDAQANNKTSVIDTGAEAMLKRGSRADVGHDIFNYKTIDVLLSLHTEQNVDVFQGSRADRVKSTLESYIHIFKTRFVRKRIRSQAGATVSDSKESVENARSQVFSDIADEYTKSPSHILQIIDSSIRKEARDALREIRSTNPRMDLRGFRNLKLYQPFRQNPSDPLAIRLGLNSEKVPANALTGMVNDREVLEKFLKTTSFATGLRAESLQTLMTAQGICGDLAFKILFQKHVPVPDKKCDVIGKMGLERFKAIVACRSMLLKRLDWFLPYRHSLQAFDESMIENDEKAIATMADLFDRFFGVCFKANKKYCDQWMQKVILFCASNHDNKAFFDDLVKEAVASIQEKTATSSFQAMSAKWKEYSFLTQNEKNKQRSRVITGNRAKLSGMKEMLGSMRAHIK